MREHFFQNRFRRLKGIPLFPTDFAFFGVGKHTWAVRRSRENVRGVDLVGLPRKVTGCVTLVARLIFRLVRR